MTKKIITPKKGKKKKVFRKKMETVLKEAKAGELNIGKSNKKVKDRKQAIAIALSEASKAVKRKSIKKSKKKRSK